MKFVLTVLLLFFTIKLKKEIPVYLEILELFLKQ